MRQIAVHSVAEGALLKRTPTTNPDAEDLALQCDGVTMKLGYIGKDADAAYTLCEQPLSLDPHNVRRIDPHRASNVLQHLFAEHSVADIARAKVSTPTRQNRRRSL